MAIRVEFYGIPRARAGVPSAESRGNNLGDVLVDLAERFPELSQSCIDGRELRQGYAANLDGRRFVTSPDTPLVDGETILFLSLDAGG